MSIKKLTKYCSDTGKYSIDVSKILLGSVVISPVVKGDFSLSTDGNMVLIGTIASLFMATAGIVLANVNK
ncbi:MAG: hypothetical protein LBL94_06535 [Prevotellaceae bacterium]|nr:hypothetical protein [Prevotellaceae bacterium]